MAETYGAAEHACEEAGAPVVEQSRASRAVLPLIATALLATAALMRAGLTAPGAGARAGATELTYGGEGDDDALAYFLEMGCSYDDDDSYFLEDSGCISGDSWTCENRLYSNDAMEASGAVPFFTNNTGGLCYDSCSTSLERTWGVPCAWQLISDLPRACAGTAKPDVTKLLSSNNVDPSGSPVYFKQQYGTQGKTQKQYDCNLHAFCNACSYENGTINKYCAATVKYYNSFEMDARVMIHTTDFWCQDDVLAAIEDGLETFMTKFGTHKPWWEGNSTGDYIYRS